MNRISLFVLLALAAAVTAGSSEESKETSGPQNGRFFLFKVKPRTQAEVLILTRSYEAFGQHPPLYLQPVHPMKSVLVLIEESKVGVLEAHLKTHHIRHSAKGLTLIQSISIRSHAYYYQPGPTGSYDYQSGAYGSNYYQPNRNGSYDYQSGSYGANYYQPNRNGSYNYPGAYTGSYYQPSPTGSYNYQSGSYGANYYQPSPTGSYKYQSGSYDSNYQPSPDGENYYQPSSDGKTYYQPSSDGKTYYQPSSDGKTYYQPSSDRENDEHNTDKVTCDCDYHRGGCTISKPPPEGHACKCVYKGAWTCNGHAFSCDPGQHCPANCSSLSCCQTGRGDCGGY